MKISILGAGSWGLALSDVLSFNGQDVLVYARRKELKEEIQNGHTSIEYLNGVKISDNIKVTDNLSEALFFSDYLVIAVPSIAIQDCLQKIKDINPNAEYFFINTVKGLSVDTENTMQNVISNFFPNRKGLVSILGPSFASEVLLKNITCVCAVSENIKDAQFVQNLFMNSYFRVYVQDDVIGAEIFSSLKNAIAIASGIVKGLGYGENTKASLITRGLKEIARIGHIFGAKKATILSLTGVGDLILTCSSTESRNFQAGYMIGKDNSAEGFLKQNNKTVEGLMTIAVTEKIIEKYNLDLPILHSLYLIIYENKKPSEVIHEIINREVSDENKILDILSF